MILAGRKYLESLLKEIGIKQVFTNLAALEGAMKPIEWAIVENPEPEDYSPSVDKLYTDQDFVRTYYRKEYDITAILTVRIGAPTDERVNQYKRQFLKKLEREILDSEGFRIDIIPLSSDLNPELFELSEDPNEILRIRFVGGLWKQTEVKLLKGIDLEGEIIKKGEGE